MSAIDELDLSELAGRSVPIPTTALTGGVPVVGSVGSQLLTDAGELWSAIKPTIGNLFWKWYHDHAADNVITVKWFIFPVDVKVNTLHPLFVLLFGDDPNVTTQQAPAPAAASIPPAPAAA